jgi:hypothetical protein
VSLTPEGHATVSTGTGLDLNPCPVVEHQ